MTVSLHLTPYLIPLLLATAFSLAAAVYVWRRPGVAGSAFLALWMLATAGWSFGYAMELSSSSLAAKMFWARFEMIGIAPIPVLWLAFVLIYTGHMRLARRRYLLLALIIPALTILLAWTNPLRHFIWLQIGILSGASTPQLAIVYGLWFWVNLAYAYILGFIAVLMSLQALHLSLRLYRTQALALLFGSLVPWLANLFYISKAGPFNNLDLTPFVFALSAAAITWGLYRYQLTDIIPVARASIVEGMEEGVIVINRHGQVADLNPAAERIIGASATAVMGRQMEAVLPGWNEVAIGLDQAQPAYTELELREGYQRQVYGVQVNRLNGSNEPFHGLLIVLRDVTEKRRQEEQIRQLNQMLKILNAGSQVVARAADEKEVVEELCRLLVRQAGYCLAWLGYLDPRDPHKILPEASSGVCSKNPLPESLTLYPAADLAIRAIQSGEAAVTQRVEMSSQSDQTQISVVSLPLRTEGQPFGALTILSQQEGRFQPQEVRLLAELADNLAYGIRLLRSREEARSVGEALRESEQKYRTLFEASADAILVETFAGRILDVNGAACSLFGYQRAEIVSLAVTDLIPAEVLEFAARSDQRAARR